ncbi:EsaB/YukD family protein [Lacticaseibacillus parahuelsenbergensis]|uniref:EsaB/YukD family protein n=1 Tax=Lacticaseibacillus parahuelsenbergensis TaxID=3068305 RepID=A0ABY9L104_9LACO|nr:EsaB/YukD family protein [Lacticaseibacillus sp. NCIMB 15471]WLV77391.1 EsaB/YukD family protein [Lacticaseibacillus sp. NCIMB 15471]
MAKKQEAINIELKTGNQLLDLRVPKYVTVSRLKKLLVPILQAKHLVLPASWRLVQTTKHLVMDERTLIANYPIADGDRFEIEFLEETK